jgi:hypothetical protein
MAKFFINIIEMSPLALVRLRRWPGLSLDADLSHHEEEDQRGDNTWAPTK